jgi:hypothetical protein
MRVMSIVDRGGAQNMGSAWVLCTSQSEADFALVKRVCTAEKVF